MSIPKVREVNVVPLMKVKKEIVEDEDEENVICVICKKVFMSELAVLNHARVEHIDEYMAGEDLCVRPVAKPTRKLTQQEEVRIKQRAEELLSSMQPTNIMQLASNDVSYIIIKDGQPEVKRFRKAKKGKEKAVKIIKPGPKKERKIKAISGPFECLQPSTHNAEAPCHQIFLSCCEYSAHYRDEHMRRRKASRCQVCEKPLGESDQVAPYPCQLCGMGFQTPTELTDHNQTTHVRLKPFQCTICQKRFTQQGGVQQHMRMHTGDKPFTCSYCKKGFTQKSGLDQHLRIHTKVKPYKCIICSKAFCQSVHLQQHMRTHTNVTPFQCGICQKRFKQSSHLNYHLKYHNPATMTDEQKAKYAQLVQLMGKHETIEIEIDTSHTDFLLDQVENEQVAEEFVV